MALLLLGRARRRAVRCSPRTRSPSAAGRRRRRAARSTAGADGRRPGRQRSSPSGERGRSAGACSASARTRSSPPRPRRPRPTATTERGDRDGAATHRRPTRAGESTGGPRPRPGGAADVQRPVAPASRRRPARRPSAQVRALLADGALRRERPTRSSSMNLPRLKALPSADDPLLVYLGPGKGGKSAIFMVDAASRPRATARATRARRTARRSSCARARRSSSTSSTRRATVEGPVPARPGQDQAQHHGRPAKAAAARAKASKAGRRVLRARQAASGPLRYRYDAKSGTVRKIAQARLQGPAGEDRARRARHRRRLLAQPGAPGRAATASRLAPS